MKIFQTFAAILFLGTVSVAQSKTVDLGTLDGGPRLFGNIIDQGQSFGDQVNFTLGGLSDVFGLFDSTSINDFSVELQRQVVSGWETVGPSFDSDFSFSGLSSGLYRFDVGGQAFLDRNAVWGAAVIVAAVPEADTWLMILIGAGLIAYQLRRKQRSLPAQALTAA